MDRCCTLVASPKTETWAADMDDEEFENLEKLAVREELYDDLQQQLDDLRQEHLEAIEDLNWCHEQEIDKVRAEVEKEHKRPWWKSVLTACVCGLCALLIGKLNHEFGMFCPGRVFGGLSTSKKIEVQKGKGQRNRRYAPLARLFLAAVCAPGVNRLRRS